MADGEQIKAKIDAKKAQWESEWAAHLGLTNAAGLVNWPAQLADAAGAVEFALNNAFRPFWALTAQELTQDTLATEMLDHANAGVRLGVRAVCAVQSFLSIVLAFLFALAVRRRFQIG